jgi:hypothetical protein
MPEADAAAAAAAVAATVSIKLPSFWCSGSAAWFFQAEAQFALRGIVSDETKYYYVVAALDSTTAQRATSVLQDPPAGDTKYQSLKDFLLGAFEPTEAERGERLLAVSDLGDGKPSELADRILALNGTAPQHFLLRSLFLRALPAAVRNAISTSPLKDLRQLALEADKVAASCAGSFFVTSATEQPATAPGVLALGTTRTSRRLCKYHQRFGRSAKRCCSPCDWTTEPPRRQGNAEAGPR